MITTIPKLPAIVREKSTVQPINVFELGASNGMDAAFLQTEFNIDPANVYCFEPNPNNFLKLSSTYPQYNNIHAAVSNFTGKDVFQLHNPAADISSFKKRISHYMYNGNYQQNYTEYEISVYRMDDFIEQRHIKTIDLCKIDVEGCTYEVLEGFGSFINIVKVMHIEGELITLYENQKLFEDFKQLLISRGFSIVDYVEFDGNTQCDSIWVKNEYLK